MLANAALPPLAVALAAFALLRAGHRCRSNAVGELGLALGSVCDVMRGRADRDHCTHGHDAEVMPHRPRFPIDDCRDEMPTCSAVPSLRWRAIGLRPAVAGAWPAVLLPAARSRKPIWPRSVERIGRRLWTPPGWQLTCGWKMRIARRAIKGLGITDPSALLWTGLKPPGIK